MTDLSSLISRVEKATGPSRDLDGDIEEATGGCAHRETEYYCIEDGNDVDSGFTCKRCGIDLYGQRAPAYTSSVDAAISLAERVLPGWTIASIGQDDRKGWHAELRKGHATAYSTVELSGAPIPALALVLATLRAIQSQKGEA